MTVPLEAIGRAIHALRDELALLGQQDPERAARLRREADDVLAEVRAAACARAGVPLGDYLAMLQEHPSLRVLERDSREEGLGGAPDPGPYDAISRESPTAREGDLKKPRND